MGSEIERSRGCVLYGSHFIGGKECSSWRVKFDPIVSGNRWNFLDESMHGEKLVSKKLLVDLLAMS